MRFWDTSALVPLLIDEAMSWRVNEYMDVDEEIAVWWSTGVECASALERRCRLGEITAESMKRAFVTLEAFQSVWHEVLPSDEVRRQARRLLHAYPLRTADALQLAAAIVWSVSYGEGDFITFDEDLHDASRREGFGVLRRS